MKRFDAHRSGPCRRGFTLVEVVIALMLVLVVMVPVSRLSFLVIRNTQYARDAGEALALGQARLEEMAEADYADIATGAATDGQYDFTWTVTESGGRKVVELVVAWSIMGNEQEVDLNTVFTEDLESSYTLP